MTLKFDPKLCVRRQIGAYRLETKVSEEQVAAALARLAITGIQIPAIQAVLGMVLANWSQEEYQLVAGIEHALRRRHFTAGEFVVYAADVRRAFARDNRSWELDVSPMDILRLERPLSFPPDDDDPQDDT